MSRPARVLGDGIGYHAIARFNNKQRILTDAKDCKILLSIIEHYRKKLSFELHAYVFLQTHIHLMLTTHDGFHLNEIMQRICMTFAHDFNRRHQRCGHIWRARYRSFVVDTDEYAMACMRYLDLNPVRAGLVKHPAEWEWSSHKFYTQGFHHPGMSLGPHTSYSTLAARPQDRKRVYQSLFLCELDEDVLEEQIFEGKMRVDSRRGQRFFRLFSSQVLQRPV